MKKIRGILWMLCLAACVCFCMPQKAYAKAGDGAGIAVNVHTFRDGWLGSKADGTMINNGQMPTALCMEAEGRPEGVGGGVAYQVNLSGYGWLDPVSDGRETGSMEDAMLESVKVWLTGEMEQKYDVYVRVFQNGSWTGWSKNGEKAGTDGVGTHIDGVCVSLTDKDAGEPGAAAAAGSLGAVSMGAFDPSRPMIALTFDDGPKASVTNRVLAALESVGGRATFFMVGSNVGSNADCVRRMVADGCQVGNHNWNHENLTKETKSETVSTVTRTNDAIEAACGVRPVVMRPPYGAVDAASKVTLGELGMAAVIWNVDTLDWKTRNAQNTVTHILNNVKDGDIILMHDIYDATATAVEAVVPALVARGYQLVTVSGLAAARGGMVPGGLYGRFRP